LLNESISINGPDYQKLVDFRTELVNSISDDISSMKTLQINSMGDTDTVYSVINPGDDSILDNEMPDILSHFNGPIHLALERQGSLT
jgi:septation ring formation regulator EzrA